MANFYDILQNVCILAHEELPSSFSDSSDPYPEIKQYIKNTVEEICSKFPWTFREKKYELTTTATQREYTLPTGLLAANILQDGIRIESFSKPLYFMNHYDLDKLILSSGKPYRYSVYSGKLILDPTPDDVYNVQIKYLTANFATSADGLTEKSNLSLETDISIIPDRHAKVIEWGTYSLYRQNFKPDEKYGLARNKFLEYLLDMQKEDGYGQDSSASINIDIQYNVNTALLGDFFNPRT
ncbi:MAG: hypothetical protein A2287_07170 [Candidatus Melainabacteria bacterium RIFOXYA12_FULL_32_12]|nr:MAG: hypothetical protein A2255_00110 [Candidatus Melainabacteria bacterium RIFOXYA2_FULL_32_9]OGI26994.1 MAG: hypothetical protein A2287_07170 [Candidatus Melainabacteria bacterium RIFOXYA12_FULL_32_12]